VALCASFLQIREEIEGATHQETSGRHQPETGSQVELREMRAASKDLRRFAVNLRPKNFLTSLSADANPHNGQPEESSHTSYLRSRMIQLGRI
jgi:hypothetical protein